MSMGAGNKELHRHDRSKKACVSEVGIVLLVTTGRDPGDRQCERSGLCGCRLGAMAAT